MIFKNFHTMLILSISMLFFFTDILMFNEEVFISLSLMLIFYAIYKILHKSITLFFAIDVEHIYLSLTYLFKLNIHLDETALYFCRLYIIYRFRFLNIGYSDLKHIYIKILSKKLIKLENCLFLIARTSVLNKEFWQREVANLMMKKIIIPSKIYSLLKFNDFCHKGKYNESIYETYFFISQFLHIVFFFQFTTTLNKFIKSYIK
jgi:hypothetical protein